MKKKIEIEQKQERVKYKKITILEVVGILLTIIFLVSMPLLFILLTAKGIPKIIAITFISLCLVIQGLNTLKEFK